LSSAELDARELDATELDATELDATELDAPWAVPESSRSAIHKPQRDAGKAAERPPQGS
jgi:hypothetical protein